MNDHLVQLTGNSFQRQPEETVLLHYRLVVGGSHHLPAVVRLAVDLEEPCQIEPTRTMSRAEFSQDFFGVGLRADGRSPF